MNNLRSRVWVTIPVILSTLCGIGLLGAFAASAATHAATHTVCVSGCDFDSIQAAVDFAAPDDELALAGETFTETVTVDKDLVIRGAGAESTIIQAAGSLAASTSRVITITGGVSATISGVTIRFGEADEMAEDNGGGILNNGSLLLQSSAVLSSTAGRGGGVYVDANALLDVNESEIRGNTSTSAGGGIYVSDGASLSVNSSSIMRNESGTDGGGISMSGNTLQIIDSQVSYNEADDDGGGVRFYYDNALDDMLVSLTVFEGNYAGDMGGGIYTNAEWVTVTQTTFRANEAGVEGGGMVASLSDHFSISDSRFEGNAGYPGSGLWVNSLSGIVQDTVFYANTGGGIFIEEYGVLAVRDCTFEENRGNYGGAIFNYNNLHVSGSLFVRNSGGRGGAIMNKDSRADMVIETSAFYSNTTQVSNFFDGSGGAIHNRVGADAVISTTTFFNNRAEGNGGVFYVYASDVHVANSTLSGNRADKGGAFYSPNGTESSFTNVTVYGNVVTDTYGGVYLGEFASLTLTHSIIAGSQGGADCAYDTTQGSDGTLGYVIDNGYNIIEDGTCLTEGSSLAADPKLEPLADNGGATQTHALMEDSPAIDMIPANECAVSIDQRGVYRPQGIACDTGAFESGATGFNIFLPLAIR